MMTETGVRLTNPPIRVMLVLPGEELWGAEQLRADLAAAGLRLMAEEEFRHGDANPARRPAAVLAFLSGRLERDAVVCRRLVHQRLAPVVAVSANSDETYVLEIFATGVEDVVRRPIKSRELAARIRSILRRTQPGLISAQDSSPRLAAPAAAAGRHAAKGSRFQSFLTEIHKCLSSRGKAN